MIKYVDGDLFKSIDGNHEKETIIIPHIVNSKKGWGAGFVVPLANAYPETRDSFFRWSNTHEDTDVVSHTGPYELGHVQFVRVSFEREKESEAVIDQKAEVTKFKVGDRVRVISEQFKGSIGHVDKMQECGLRMAFRVKSSDNSLPPCYYHETELELAPKPNIVVANMVAQTLGGERPISYKYLGRCMEAVSLYCESIKKHDGIPRIVAPMFGSGLARGKWSFIEQLIEDYWGNQMEIQIHYLPEYLPKDWKLPERGIHLFEVRP